MGRLAVLVAALDDNVIFLAAVREGGDPARVQHGLQSAADIRDRHAEIRRAVAVDIHHELGLGLLVIGVEAGQAGILPRLLEDNVAPARELVIGIAADHELHRIAAAAAQALGQPDEDLDAGNLAHFLADDRCELGRRHLPLAPRLHRNEHVALVHGVAAAPARHARRGAHHRTVLDVRQKNRLDLVKLVAGIVVARAFRRLELDLHPPLILGRRELARDDGEHEDGEPGYAKHRPADQNRMGQAGSERVPIGRRELLEDLVDVIAETAPLGIVFQYLRAHHGSQSERDESREGDRRPQSRRQFGEHAARRARQEHDRHEHRDQNQSRGHDGEAHLPRPAIGRE